MLKVKSHNKFELSVAKIGSTVSVNLPLREYESSKDALDIYKNHTPGTLSTYLRSLPEQDRKEQAVLITKLLKQETKFAPPLSLHVPNVTGVFSHEGADVSAGLPSPSLDELCQPVDPSA